MKYIEALLAANMLFPSAGAYSATENEEPAVVAEASAEITTTEDEEDDSGICFRPTDCIPQEISLQS